MEDERDLNNSKYLEILYISAELEEFLEYILIHKQIKYEPHSLQSKIRCFCAYIDNRDAAKKSTDKIFESKYSLKDALSNIKKDRDIAVHQANNLISGLSNLPKLQRQAGTKFSKQYIGNIDKLHKDFMKYADMLLPLYENVQHLGVNAFETIEIDGS